MRPSKTETRWDTKKNLNKVNETRPKVNKSRLSKWDETQKSKKFWSNILDETYQELALIEVSSRKLGETKSESRRRSLVDSPPYYSNDLAKRIHPSSNCLQSIIDQTTIDRCVCKQSFGHPEWSLFLYFYNCLSLNNLTLFSTAKCLGIDWGESSTSARYLAHGKVVTVDCSLPGLFWVLPLTKCLYTNFSNAGGENLWVGTKRS